MVTEQELNDLRKLPPKERLRRLEQLKLKEEEERKKREQETREIIEESLKEIKLDEMLQEIDIPKEEKVDIDKLFEESKHVEEQVKVQKIKIDASAQQDYARRIQELLPRNTIEEIQGWYARDNVPPTREEFLDVYEHARQAYETVRQSMNAAPDQQLYSTPSEELVDSVVESMRLMRSMGYKMKWFGS